MNVIKIDISKNNDGWEIFKGKGLFCTRISRITRIFYNEIFFEHE